VKGRRHEDGMFYGALYLLCLFCSFLIKEVSCGVPVPGLLTLAGLTLALGALVYCFLFLL
jgi:hypothetical protein